MPPPDGAGPIKGEPRRVPLALTVGGGLLPWTGVAGSIRVPFQHAVAVPRWRPHFDNINPREGWPGQGRYTVDQVAIGASDGQGGWITAPAVIAGSLSGARAGVTTPWLDYPLEAGVEYLLAYSWRSTHPTKRVVGGGWIASDLLDQGATLTATQNHPLDAWIEAEVAADTKVLAVFGDSVSSGVTATVPVRDSWPSIYTRRIGALPIHYTASGDTMKGWMNPAHYKWQRWEQLTRPNTAVHAMGLNDINNGIPLWELQHRHLETIDLLHERLTPDVRVATITPATHVAPDLQTTRRAYNNWLMHRSPDTLRFHETVSADDRRISPGFNVDGTHMNATGYRAMANSINDRLV